MIIINGKPQQKKEPFSTECLKQWAREQPGYWTSADATKATGFSRDICRKRLKELESEGVVEKRKNIDGGYRWPRLFKVTRKGMK